MSSTPGLELMDLLEFVMAVVFVLFVLIRMPLGDLLGFELRVLLAT